MDENLARWIFQSIASHFQSVATGLSLPYFVEGIDERAEDDMRADHVELRVTGPTTKEVSKGYYLHDVVINFMFTKQMEMSGADAFDLIQWTGVFANEMLEEVPIYRKGTGPADDDTLVGCLKVKKHKNEMVRIYHFGQLNKDLRIRQSEIDAVYGMELSN
jgi:hypothetical protein